MSYLEMKAWGETRLVGAGADMAPRWLRHHVRLTNQTALFFLLIIALSLPLTAAVGVWFASFIALTALNFFLVTELNHRGRHGPARALLLLNATLILTISHWVLGPNANMEEFCYALAGLSLLLYSRRESTPRLASFLLLGALGVALRYVDWPGLVAPASWHSATMTALHPAIIFTILFVTTERIVASMAQRQRMLNNMVTHAEAQANALANANAELQREGEYRQAMERELEVTRRLEAVGQLAAGIAHEINTPIQYVGDNLDFIRESTAQLNHVLLAISESSCSSECMAWRNAMARAPATDVAFLTEEIPKAIEQSLDGVKQVARIVQAMKTFSHCGTEQMADANLNEVIQTAVDVSRNEWKYIASVNLHLDPDTPEIACHRGEVGQIFLNLIVNAAHAVKSVVGDSDARGEISITSRVKGDGVEISVRDSGCGMSPEVKKKIFDPFFTTKPVGTGTGQGLTFVQAIVNRHHGRVRVESTPGNGATFAVWLPRSQPDEEQSADIFEPCGKEQHEAHHPLC